MGVVDFVFCLCIVTYFWVCLWLSLLLVRGFPCRFSDWKSFSQIFCHQQRQTFSEIKVASCVSASLALTPLTTAVLQQEFVVLMNEWTKKPTFLMLIRSQSSDVFVCSWLVFIRIYKWVLLAVKCTVFVLFLQLYPFRERVPVNLSPWFSVFLNLRLIFNAPNDF